MLLKLVRWLIHLFRISQERNYWYLMFVLWLDEGVIKGIIIYKFQSKLNPIAFNKIAALKVLHSPFLMI